MNDHWPCVCFDWFTTRLWSESMLPPLKYLTFRINLDSVVSIWVVPWLNTNCCMWKVAKLSDAGKEIHHKPLSLVVQWFTYDKAYSRLLFRRVADVVSDICLYCYLALRNKSKVLLNSSTLLVALIELNLSFHIKYHS